MQENFEIIAVSRPDAGKGASRRLRKTGMVPGIIYGGGEAPEMVSTAHNELLKHLEHEAFYSHILTVKVDDKAQKVVLKDLQRHPSKPFITHFDLQRVGAEDRIKMHVPLHFIGENVAPGIKQGGQALHNITNVEVLCQAKDLPEFIEVDVSAMEKGQALHLSDLKLPEGLELALLAAGGEHDLVVISIQGVGGGADASEAEEA